MIAALITAHNAPLELANVEPCDLAPGQVLVNMLASGICGAQLAEIRGEKDETAPIPRLLGHEGCGIVDSVGPGVTKVKTGDKVCCHWRKSFGMDSEYPRYTYEGREITSGRIATFAERAIISENRLTKVPLETPNELVALLGCGLSTAFGVMENEAQLKMGESVLIVGCGGVGLNLIRVARMCGARLIGGVDLSTKTQQVLDSGADFFTNISRSNPGGKYDVIVDTTGSLEAIADTLPLLASGGRYILLGQPKPEASIVIVSARHMFDGGGKRIIATQGGQFDPDRDLPRYTAMWRSGFLKINGIITHRFPLKDVNTALDVVRSGQGGRVMLEMS